MPNWRQHRRCVSATTAARRHTLLPSAELGSESQLLGMRRHVASAIGDEAESSVLAWAATPSSSVLSRLSTLGVSAPLLLGHRCHKMHASVISESDAPALSTETRTRRLRCSLCACRWGGQGSASRAVGPRTQRTLAATAGSLARWRSSDARLGVDSASPAAGGLAHCCALAADSLASWRSFDARLAVGWASAGLGWASVAGPPHCYCVGPVG